ncbi:hypothetical protein T08_4902 [Trichinella sp. T8]|nr:hypothetical protein T08_4902 [Trichinella sp. T8]
MRSLIQMVCLAAYATRHGSTVCYMAHDPCFCPSRLTAVEEQGSGTPRVWAVLKWHLRVTCLTKEQWELNYDHDVCVADSPLALYQWFSTWGPEKLNFCQLFFLDILVCILVPFTSTYLCETGFSALMALHTHLQGTLSPTAPRIHNTVTNSIECFTVETRLA